MSYKERISTHERVQTLPQTRLVLVQNNACKDKKVRRRQGYRAAPRKYQTYILLHVGIAHSGLEGLEL